MPIVPYLVGKFSTLQNKMEINGIVANTDLQKFANMFLTFFNGNWGPAHDVFYRSQW